MPVFTQPISNQNTGYSSGIRSYPQVASVQQYLKMSDEFRRETLNPSNSYPLYTSSAGAGTGAATIGAGMNGVIVQSSNSTNDNTTLRTSGLAFNRQAIYIDSRSQLEFNAIFFSSFITSEKFFIGLVQQNTAITALPNTARHIGLFADTSGTGTFTFSSANGTTRVTADTTRALDSQGYRLQIIWNGLDSATMNLYGPGSPNYSNLLYTTSITSLNNGGDSSISYELQIFIQSLTTSNRNFTLLEWDMLAT